jgi:CHAT domain-containing protein
MSVYAELRRRPAGKPGTTPERLLALGDPLYPSPGDAPRPPQLAQATRGRQLSRLTGTRDEVTAIGRIYGARATVQTGPRATKRVLLREAPRAGILHFACHGVFDDRDPLASALALTPEGAEEDGLLRAYDVLQRVRLNADLVVMSGCETGLGEVTRHEGILGLTRAFQYAGARSVLVSLWQIPDRSTAVLMAEFYRQLRAGIPKDEALRRAQQALLRRGAYAHPYHWAAFVLTGDWK